MKITSALFDKMKRSAEESFEMLDQGKSAFRIIADMYRQTIPESTGEEAEAAALRIVNQVHRYYETRKSALGNEDGWVDEQIEKLCEGRTRLERCRLMAQLLDGLMMLSGDASGEFVPGRRAAAYTEENVTRQIEAELRNKLSRAVADSGLGAAGMEELSGLLDECGVEEAAELVVGFGEKQQDVDAVYAMIAYLNGLKHVRGFDRDITPEEAALAVCAAGDRLRTAHSVSVGEMTAEAGSKVLRIIGAVTGFLLDVALSLMVGGAAFLTLSLLALILDFGLAVVIGGAAVAATLTGIAMFSGTKALGQKAVRLPVKIVKGAAGLIARGWKALTEALRSRFARPMKIRTDIAADAETAVSPAVPVLDATVSADA